MAGVSLAWAQVDSTPFRFVAWGDSRGSKKGVNTVVLSGLSGQAYNLVPRPEFTLFQGDLCNSFDATCTSTGTTGWMYAINNGNSPSNGMFDITFVTRGNHDTGSGPPTWPEYFDMEGMASSLGATSFDAQVDDETYSFDYGNSHFVTVDIPGDVNIITAAQIDWLDADLTSAEGRGLTHSFIFWHGPIYCVDGHCSYSTTLGSAAPAGLVTVLSSHPSITATFHGHEHVNSYTHVDSNRIAGLAHPFEQFVTGEAGAPPYDCTKTNRFSSCTITPGFVTVDVNGTVVTVSQYLQGGGSTPVEVWTFNKGLPAVTLSPTSLTFAGELVGSTSAPQTVTLSNTGDATLTFSGSPVPSGDFAFADAGTCGSTLDAGDSCTINVTFTPTAPGTRTGTVTITDNALNSPQTISLTGFGQSATTLSVSPTSLNFGRLKVGTTSAPQTVTVSNTGSSPATIYSVGTAGPFAQTNNCVGALAAGTSCTIAVTYTPTIARAQTGTLTISDDAPGSPRVVALSGRGAKH